MNLFFEKNKQKIIILSLFIFAFCIRIYDVHSYSLWFDETLNFRLSSLPWETLWISNFDPTPPLYYSLLKLYITSTTSEFYLRLPSVIFGSGTVVVFYAICKLKFSTLSSVIASILFSLSVHQVMYSQEARVYAMALFFGLCMLYVTLLYIFEQKERYKLLFWYVLTAILALYSHNIVVFYILAANLLAFYFFIKEKRFNSLKYWILANGTVFLIWLPWPLVTVLSGEENSFNWLQHLTILQFIKSTILSISVFPFPSGLLLNAFFFIFLFAAGIFSVKDKNKNFLISICVIAFTSILLVWLTGYFRPIFMSRTILISSVLIYLLLPFLLERLNKSLTLLSSSVLIIIHAFALYSFNQNNYSENEPWKQAVAEILSTKTQNILMCSSSPTFATNYYLNDPSVIELSLSQDDTELITLNADLANVMENIDNSIEETFERKPFSFADNAIFIKSHCSKRKLAIIESNFNLQELKVDVYKGIDLYQVEYKQSNR